jgi:hypothetical protein
MPPDWRNHRRGASGGYGPQRSKSLVGAKVVNNVVGSGIAEGTGWGYARSGTQVVAAHDAGSDVAGRVEPGDRTPGTLPDETPVKVLTTVIDDRSGPCRSRRHLLPSLVVSR